MAQPTTSQPIGHVDAQNIASPQINIKLQSSEEIVNIIKACSEAKVSYFEHGDLKLSFSPYGLKSEYEFTSKINQPKQEVNAPQVVREGTTDETTQVDYELELSNLMLQDPLAYEQFISKDAQHDTRGTA